MKFIVKGGKPLHGEVQLAGAKNAATKLMVASLLTDEKCELNHFPDIGDTEITAELLKGIGSNVTYKEGSLFIETPSIRSDHAQIEQSRRNRIPILLLGPLLARVGEAEVPFVGGDKLGARPVDLHIKALEALGAQIEVRKDTYYAVAKEGLRGAEIRFEFPSVGATESAILSAVLAKGKTVLRNAALEPEIMSVVKMLQKMGAIIELGANRDFYIEGVSKLRGVRHKVLPDRNEAVSFACLAIATGGKILVKDAVQDHLITFLNTVRRLGAEYEVTPEGIVFWRPLDTAHGRPNSLKPLQIETAVHPGFMTDWQQPFAVLLTQVEGISSIHEAIYEDRFGYTKDLEVMGAHIETKKECPSGPLCRFWASGSCHYAEIQGVTELHGANSVMRDLRAGMVNLTAALVASGESEISGIEEIDRGYEKIDERLRALGADITRVD